MKESASSRGFGLYRAIKGINHTHGEGGGHVIE